MKTKRIILFIALMLSLSFIKAQITITYDDQPPLPLSTIENYTSISGLDVSANGANQTWDLSELAPEGSSTLDIVYLNSLPFANQFPNGNYAVSFDDYYYSIISKNSNNLSIIGSVYPVDQFNTTVYVKNSSPELIYTFPFTMGSVVESYPRSDTKIFIDTTINSIYIDSAAIDIKSYVKKEVVGWGTLVLSNGNFQVLKVAVSRKDTMTVNAKLMGMVWTPIMGDTSQSNSIEFAMKNLLYPLSTVELDSNQQPTNVYWVYVDPSLDINENVYSNIKYFPNPVIDNIVFEANEPINKIVILSLDGKKVLEKDFDFEKTFSIDLNNLQSGTYLFTLYNDKSIIRTGKIIKE
ncbi:MAG TPA: T9SS type A sorting domain-containing protein [Bacteroidales bacterium]|nr:T9SS type A sorting domain-containing protein [Bacteroidales bacterium]